MSRGRADQDETHAVVIGPFNDRDEMGPLLDEIDDVVQDQAVTVQSSPEEDPLQEAIEKGVRCFIEADQIAAGNPRVQKAVNAALDQGLIARGRLEEGL